MTTRTGVGIAIVMLVAIVLWYGLGTGALSDWYTDGVFAGQREGGNFVSGDGVVWTAVDNPANSRVNLTAAVNLYPTSTAGTATSSPSGLAFQTGTLTLLPGCNNGQVVARSTSTNAYECTSVGGLGAITGAGDLLVSSGGLIAFATTTAAGDMLTANDTRIAIATTTIAGTALDASDTTISFDSTEVATTTWGSGDSFTWTFDSGGTDPDVTFLSGATVFNESQSDIDFRVEGDTNSNVLHINAGGDSIGLFTTGTTDHAIVFNGTATGPAGNNAILYEIGGALTMGAPPPNNRGFLTDRSGTINSHTAGTHILLATVRMQAPNIVSNGATITNAATLYISEAPTEGTNDYALWSDSGLNRFDGDGSHVFELPADATGNATAATGRIPIDVGGATKYLRYYDD